MSLELRDVRSKAFAEDDIALDSYATAHGIDKSELVRNIIHDWGRKQRHAAKLMQARLEREGFSGNLGEDDPE